MVCRNIESDDCLVYLSSRTLETLHISAPQLLGFKVGSVPRNNEVSQAYQVRN